MYKIIFIEKYLIIKLSPSFKSESKMSFGKFASFTQFVLYGKQYCTATGYESTRAKYPKPDILDDTSMTLEDKVFIITGANAGIGREITQYLATKRATVYMFCRRYFTIELFFISYCIMINNYLL
jgi:hypothetical protein